jgi:hypothetical protein
MYCKKKRVCVQCATTMQQAGVACDYVGGCNPVACAYVVFEEVPEKLIRKLFWEMSWLQ